MFTIEVPGSFLGRHPRVVIPAAMWVWVNVHGTFSLGFVYLAVYLFGRYLDGAPPNRGRERDLVIGTAIAAALIFVNPYGPGLVLFPLALMGRNEVLSNVAGVAGRSTSTASSASSTPSGSSSRSSRSPDRARAGASWS